MVLEAWEKNDYSHLMGKKAGIVRALQRIGRDHNADFINGLDIDALRQASPIDFRAGIKGLGIKQRKWMTTIHENGGFWHPKCNFSFENVLTICNCLEKRGLLFRDTSPQMPQPCFRIALSQEEMERLVCRPEPTKGTGETRGRKEGPREMQPLYPLEPYVVFEEGLGQSLRIGQYKKTPYPLATINALQHSKQAQEALADLFALSPRMAKILHRLVQLEDLRSQAEQQGLPFPRQEYEATYGSARDLIAKLPLKREDS